MTVMINNPNDLEELSETAVVKYCRMCGAAKSIDRFHRDKRCFGGHDTVCKGCVNKRNRYWQPFSLRWLRSIGSLFFRVAERRWIHY